MSIVINLKSKKNMKDSITKLIIGASGISAIEVVERVTAINPEQIASGTSLVVQIIVAIATLIGLFKRKKSI